MMDVQILKDLFLCQCIFCYDRCLLEKCQQTLYIGIDQKFGNSILFESGCKINNKNTYLPLQVSKKTDRQIDKKTDHQVTKTASILSQSQTQYSLSSVIANSNYMYHFCPES